jgi:hypothetical protein
MCVVCGEYEAGTFTGSVMFCSEKCEDAAIETDTDGEPIDTQGWYDNFQYDDDPSPYTGTYSEE